MSEIFGDLATALPGGGSGTTAGIGDLAKLITGGMGTVGNIITGIRGNTISSDALKNEQLLSYLMRNPQALAGMIAKLRAPLSTSLQENVMNSVQGQLASRGLGESPAIAQSVSSQAIAPYELKTQEDAETAVMRMLGLPIEGTNAAKAALPGQADTSAFWKLFQQPSANTAPGIVDTTSYSNPYPAGSTDIYSTPEIGDPGIV